MLTKNVRIAHSGASLVLTLDMEIAQHIYNQMQENVLLIVNMDTTMIKQWEFVRFVTINAHLALGPLVINAHLVAMDYI